MELRSIGDFKQPVGVNGSLSVGPVVDWRSVQGEAQILCLTLFGFEHIRIGTF